MPFSFGKLIFPPIVRSDILQRKDCSGLYPLTVKDDQVESLLFVFFDFFSCAVWFFSFFDSFHDMTRFELECANQGLLAQIRFKLGERHLTNLVAWFLIIGAMLVELFKQEDDFTRSVIHEGPNELPVFLLMQVVKFVFHVD